MALTKIPKTFRTNWTNSGFSNIRPTCGCLLIEHSKHASEFSALRDVDGVGSSFGFDDILLWINGAKSRPFYLRIFSSLSILQFTIRRSKCMMYMFVHIDTKLLAHTVWYSWPFLREKKMFPTDFFWNVRNDISASFCIEIALFPLVGRFANHMGTNWLFHCLTIFVLNQ